MTTEAVRALLNPTSLAIVGASESNPWAVGLIDNIQTWNFPGPVYMVNPTKSTVFGQTSYPDLASLPMRVSHALIVVRASLVPSVLEDCAAAGVKGVTVIAAGFAEAGADGAALAKQVVEICDRTGIEMVGPNCFGFTNFATSAVVTRNWIERPFAADGNVSLTFQSGQLALSAYGSALQRGIDLRYLVSSGNELVTDTNDYFEFFLADEGTKVLGAAVERIPEPRRFEKLALRALEMGKPIVLCKMGTSVVGSAIAMSHTGAVAGVREVVETFLSDLGVITVDSIDEMVETAGLLARVGWPQGPRTIFLGGSGGAGEYFADRADGTEVELPPLAISTVNSIAEATGLPESSLHNPVDLTASSGFGAIPLVATLVAGAGEFDALVSQGEEPLSLELQGQSMVDQLEGSMKAIAGLPAAGGWGCFISTADRAPTEFGMAMAKRHGVFYARGTVGVTAISHAIAYGSKRKTVTTRLRDTLARRASTAPGASEFLRVLSESEAKSLLAKHGVNVTRDRHATSADEAAAAAEVIGYPVVLKIDSADIPHKSEIGGVVLDVQDGAGVRRAYSDIIDNAREAFPEHNATSVLVCEQILDGVEVLMGAVVDRSIGPVVMVGMGGIFVEIMRDTALALPPFGLDKAHEMLRSLNAWPILQGVRGRQAVDIDALAEMLVAVGDLVAELGDRLVELDVNPVLARPDGVTAADALIVLREDAE